MRWLLSLSLALITVLGCNLARSIQHGRDFGRTTC